MELIFHEKQDGSLCAQHCLNALLQGPYFTAVDLANIASQLDEQESSAMGSSCGAIPSFQNMDETGYFSVQVICKALQIWSLELVPFLRQCPEAELARENPAGQKAFICHYQHHWFTIRKIGNQWFNLNSILPAPRLISETYLTTYLAQLKEEGNSIFFIIGTLPECEADQVLSICPVTEDNVIRYSLAQQDKSKSQDDVEAVVAMSQTEFDEEDVTLKRVLESSENDDPDLQRALQISADENKDMFDMELQKAISISLTALGGDTNSGRDVTAVVSTTTTTTPPPPPTTTTTTSTSHTTNRTVIPAEEIRRNRQAFLDRFSSNSET
ncbi:unnamed protein product [Trichobilharzia szidati]|nr:unnamed protein product [Trichobilharzia szidati]